MEPEKSRKIIPEVPSTISENVEVAKNVLKQEQVLFIYM